MSKVTSKLQVTIPKAVADRYRITPGDEIEFVPAGDAIRVVTKDAAVPNTNAVARRLALFDKATRRQEARQGGVPVGRPSDRGWTREDLYNRAGADRH